MLIKEKYIPVFKEIVKKIAELSTCQYRKVGAIIIKDNRIVVEGFNGAPPGFMHCSELHERIKKWLNLGLNWEELKFEYIDKDNYDKLLKKEKITDTDIKSCNLLHNTLEIHAEQNAILQAAKHGININGAAIITTHKPCLNCAKLIAGVGIKEVYYLEEYENKAEKINVEKFFEDAGIKIRKI